MFSDKTYTYDNDDRLTNVQDTLDGQCTTRAYTYDADSNRTGLTSYAPGTTGACQDSNGTTTTTETYDSADRATNTGYTYDTQGDITTTPSADAGGTGNLTATYYANDMLASQTQNSGSMTWALDPTLGRFATYTQNGVTYTNHYGDVSNNPTWTAGSDGSWTRSITDFNGNLAAQITASGVTLELPDLHGDIMATATTSAAATGPTATYLYTEFGTPETGTPGEYGWLGADEISSDALGGQLRMGARAYSTTTGRFSQTDPVFGGSANAYDYAGQNPVNNLDLSGDIYFKIDIRNRMIMFGLKARDVVNLLRGGAGALGALICGKLGLGYLCDAIAGTIGIYAIDFLDWIKDAIGNWELYVTIRLTVSWGRWWGIPIPIPHVEVWEFSILPPNSKPPALP